MNNLKNTNQTQFSFEEPIFSDVNVDLPVDEKLVEQVQKKNNKKKIIIIGAVVGVIFLILLVVLLGSRMKPEIEVLEDDHSAEVIESLSPIEERIENARIDLGVADPANQDLVFPPVDMELRLDEKER